MSKRCDPRRLFRNRPGRDEAVFVKPTLDDITITVNAVTLTNQAEDNPYVPTEEDIAVIACTAHDLIENASAQVCSKQLPGLESVGSSVTTLVWGNRGPSLGFAIKPAGIVWAPFPRVF
jgi:hypothetical protein